MEANTPAAEEKPNYEPDHNREYGKQTYWEDRFQKEESYEWLANYKQCRTQLVHAIFGDQADVDNIPAADKDLKILLIGCGNSSLGYDMWADGFTNVDCIDYAQSVIALMNSKYRDHP